MDKPNVSQELCALKLEIESLIQSKQLNDADRVQGLYEWKEKEASEVITSHITSFPYYFNQDKFINLTTKNFIKYIFNWKSLSSG